MNEDLEKHVTSGVGKTPEDFALLLCKLDVYEGIPCRQLEKMRVKTLTAQGKASLTTVACFANTLTEDERTITMTTALRGFLETEQPDFKDLLNHPGFNRFVENLVQQVGVNGKRKAGASNDVRAAKGGRPRMILSPSPPPPLAPYATRFCDQDGAAPGPSPSVQPSPCRAAPLPHTTRQPPNNSAGSTAFTTTSATISRAERLTALVEETRALGVDSSLFENELACVLQELKRRANHLTALVEQTKTLGVDSSSLENELARVLRELNRTVSTKSATAGGKEGSVPSAAVPAAATVVAPSSLSSPLPTDPGGVERAPAHTAPAAPSAAAAGENTRQAVDAGAKSAAPGAVEGNTHQGATATAGGEKDPVPAAAVPAAATVLAPTRSTTPASDNPAPASGASFPLPTDPGGVGPACAHTAPDTPSAAASEAVDAAAKSAAPGAAGENTRQAAESSAVGSAANRSPTPAAGGTTRR
ncbi:unnamed protein product, partial [Ectocarpus sp. 13 AM-2016]